MRVLTNSLCPETKSDPAFSLLGLYLKVCVYSTRSVYLMHFILQGYRIIFFYFVITDPVPIIYIV
jgi:hypothetical protein